MLNYTMSLEFLTGDCLEVMRRWPEDKFDLVFGSPPY
jgi:DNA modification methylase